MHTNLLDKQQAVERALFKKLTRKARRLARSNQKHVRSSKSTISAQQLEHQTKGQDQPQSNSQPSFSEFCVASNLQTSIQSQKDDQGMTWSLATQICDRRRLSSDSPMLAPAQYHVAHLQENSIYQQAHLTPAYTPDTAYQVQELNAFVSAFLMGVASAKLLCGLTQNPRR
jgi:hypothetical protein